MYLHAFEIRFPHISMHLRGKNFARNEMESVNGKQWYLEQGGVRWI
jgi:hypothetical protein